MLQEFLITGKKNLNSSMTLGYNEDGQLSLIKLEGDLSPKHRTWLILRAPIEMNELNNYAKQYEWTVKTLSSEVTFEEFYEQFGNKVGKKKAQLRWNRMTKEERFRAMLYIPKYENLLKMRPGQARMYPATYLNSEPWND